MERDDAAGVVRIHVEKVKFKHLGRPGEAQFVYDPVSGRYLPCEEDKSPQTPARTEGAGNPVRQCRLAAENTEEGVLEL